MKDRIKEINEEIVRLQFEVNDKIRDLEIERDEIIKKNNPPFLNPYLKFKEDGGREFLFKIDKSIFFNTGDINYYVGKILTINGAPFYHNEYVLKPERLKDDWKFISEVEFEELLSKGLDLIRKDII